MVGGIAAVREPAGGVAVVMVAKAAQVASRRSSSVRAWADGGLLDLGERLLNGVEVGRVGGQRQEAGAARLDGSPHGRAVMRAEIVGDRRPGPGAALARGSAGYSPTKRAVVIAPSNRSSGPMPSRVRAATTVLFSPRLAGAVAYAAGHAAPGHRSACTPGGCRSHPGRPDPPAERRHLLPPGRARRLVPLARPYGLFFRVWSSRVSARLIVAVLTATPDASCHQEQCSSNVASARSASRSGSAAMHGVRLHRHRPRHRLRRQPSRSCFNRSHRSMVGNDTSNSPPPSSRGCPRSTALTTRSRKSSEYGFIPTA